jgi:hypothetical protein
VIVQVLDDVEVTGAERATAAVVTAPPPDGLEALEQRVQKLHSECAQFMPLEASGSAACIPAPSSQSSAFRAPLTFDGRLLSDQAAQRLRR